MPDDLKATDIMTAPAITVGPDTSVAQVAALLATHCISAVPVKEGGRLVGLVSEADLLHRHEIDQLVGKVEREGYTVVPTALYWKGNRIKAELALARGKQTHDKRDTARERDWNREKQRVLRRHNKNA